jgi:hypothetical protein
MSYLASADEPIKAPPGFADMVEQGEPLLFMHARKLPSGKDCLVVITGKAERIAWSGRTWIGFRGNGGCFRPGTWGSPHRETFNFLTHAALFDLGFGEHATLFNAQPDRNNPSRFWFCYELDGQYGTMEGWVDDEGFTHIKPRDGPATRAVSDSE